MISCPRTSHDTIQVLVSGLLALLTLPGCSGNEQRPQVEEEPDSRNATSAGEASNAAEESVTGHTADRPKLDELLAQLVIPPPWLKDVQTQYDTSKPWKDARLEIRRLLGLGRTETHREAIKLTWLYLQKGDIGDGHEYPM